MSDDNEDDLYDEVYVQITDEGWEIAEAAIERFKDGEDIETIADSYGITGSALSVLIQIYGFYKDQDEENPSE